MLICLHPDQLSLGSEHWNLSSRYELKLLLSYDFLTNLYLQLLDSITMDGYSPQSDVKTTPRMLANMIINLTLPVGLLKQTISPGLSHSHAGVREATSRLLVCIFSRLNHHLARAQEMLEFSDEGLELTRSFILQQLTNILPPATQVWEAWKTAIAIKEVKVHKQTGEIPAVETPMVSKSMQQLICS
jgi:hypothetical protein